MPRPPDEMDERMRHCPLALEGATSTLEDIPGGVRPVVTDQVTITAADVAGGVQLDVVSQPGLVDQLRAESRQRAQKFPFSGATIHVAGGP